MPLGGISGDAADPWLQLWRAQGGSGYERPTQNFPLVFGVYEPDVCAGTGCGTVVRPPVYHRPCCCKKSGLGNSHMHIGPDSAGAAV